MTIKTFFSQRAYNKEGLYRQYDKFSIPRHRLMRKKFQFMIQIIET